ncbi:jg2077, partial [Pararge aegeria aegeria]
MPFGLKNAPATFQRLMNTVLSGLQGIHCYVYLDDIVIYSFDLDSHIQKIQREVNYLGHIITDEGVKPNTEKVRAVKEFPAPKTQKDIKSFLGLISYYRRFIPEFSMLAKPLTSLLKKDARLTQISAILLQGDIGKDGPIAFGSRTLNKAELNYSVTEKECLAIVFGTKLFRPYLYGRTFTIVTDHKPLQWLFNCKDPGSRLIRWRLKLEEYNYDIKYKKGKVNANADALSRYPVNPITIYTNNTAPS